MVTWVVLGIMPQTVLGFSMLIPRSHTGEGVAIISANIEYPGI